MMEQQQGASPATSLFRPTKRKRVYRKHQAKDDTSETSGDVIPVAGVSHSHASDNDDYRPQNSLGSGAGRPPRVSRQTKAGIAFHSKRGESTTTYEQREPLERSMIPTTGDDPTLATSRFARPTGQVAAQDDEHMMAYIEAEMAKKVSAKQDGTATAIGETSIATVNKHDGEAHRQPASQGKLHEIDLGHDAVLRNVARTEAAISGSPDTLPTVTKPPKPRIGRNGKLFMPKPRKERDAADIERDKAVEEMLGSSRLDMYGDGAQYTANGSVSQEHGDQAADDLIAEQFRREFLDAVNERRDKARSQSKTTSQKDLDDRSKGPKLGGSRSARAAMREREEAAAKAAKKK